MDGGYIATVEVLSYETQLTIKPKAKNAVMFSVHLVTIDSPSASLVRWRHQNTRMWLDQDQSRLPVDVSLLY